MEEERGADSYLAQQDRWECQLEALWCRHPTYTWAELQAAWTQTFGKGKGKGKEAHWFSSPAAQQLTSLAAHQPDEGPEQARASRPQQTWTQARPARARARRARRSSQSALAPTRISAWPPAH